MNISILKSSLFTIIMIILAYYLYWIIIVNILVYLFDASFFVNIGLTFKISFILIEIILSSIAGLIIGLPFGFIVKYKASAYAFIACLFVVVFIVFESKEQLTWLTYLSLFLMLQSITLFTFIGSKLRKTPNKPLKNGRLPTAL